MIQNVPHLEKSVLRVFARLTTVNGERAEGAKARRG